MLKINETFEELECYNCEKIIAHMTNDDAVEFKLLKENILSGKCKKFTGLIKGYSDELVLMLALHDVEYGLFDKYESLSFLPDRVIKKYVKTLKHKVNYVRCVTEEALRFCISLYDDVIDKVIDNLSDETVAILKKPESKFLPSKIIWNIVCSVELPLNEIIQTPSEFPISKLYPNIHKYQLYDDILTENVLKIIIHLLACKIALDDNKTIPGNFIDLITDEIKSIDHPWKLLYLIGILDKQIKGLKYDVMKNFSKLLYSCTYKK